MPRSRLLLNVSLLFILTPLNTSKPKSGLSVVVGGSVVMLELRKASLASFAMSLLSSLSSSINQIDGQTLQLFLINKHVLTSRLTRFNSPDSIPTFKVVLAYKEPAITNNDLAK